MHSERCDGEQIVHACKDFKQKDEDRAWEDGNRDTVRESESERAIIS